MNPALFKRYFLSFFVAYNAVVLIVAIAKLVENPDHYSWLGAASAALQVVLFFGMLYLRKPARTSRLLIGISMVILASTIYAMYVSLNFEGGSGNDPVPGFAFITLFGWIAYLVWYSELERPANKLLKIGNKLPEFLLQTTEGTTVNTKKYREAPTIYLFYRGNWCPICMGQIDEIYKNKEKFSEAGAKVVFISPQKHNKSAKLAAKFEADFDFMVDVDNKAAKKLNILHQGAVPFGFEVLGFEADAAYPTVIITDRKGKITYLHVENNYRNRPEISELLKALEN